MDQFYYESGYVVDSYFVYTADAAGTESSTFSMTADVGVIKNTQVTMTSTFEQTATISHINGADLFAFTEASLAVQVSLIRDNNIAVTAAFDIATDASRTRNYSSDDSAAFSIVVDNLRVRYEEAALDAAFSMSADVEVIIGGVTREAEAYLTAQSNITAQLDIIVQGLSDQSVQSDITVSADRTRATTADLIANFSQYSVSGRIVQGASVENALFTPNISISITKNSFAVLDSTFAVAITGDVAKTATANLASTVSMAASVEKLKGGAADLTAASSINVYNNFIIARPHALFKYTSSGTTKTITPLLDSDLSTTEYYAGSGSLYAPGLTLTTAGSVDISTGTIAHFPDVGSANRWGFAAGEDFVISFKIKFVNKPVVSGETVRLLGTGTQTAYNGWYFGYAGTPGTPVFSFFDGTARRTISLTFNINATGWLTVNISRTNGVISFGQTGYLTNTYNYNGAIITSNNGDNTLFIGGSKTGTAVATYWDELYIARGVSAPQNYFADGRIADGKLDSTVLLYHFDGSVREDVTGLANAAAALTSTTALTAQPAAGASNASANLQSSTSVSVTAKKLSNAQANLQCTGFEAVIIGSIKPSVAQLTATATMVTRGVRVKRSTVAMSSTSSLSVIKISRYGPRPWYTWSTSSTVPLYSRYSSWERIRVKNVDFTPGNNIDRTVLDFAGHKIKSLQYGSHPPIITVDGVSRFVNSISNIDLDIIRGQDFTFFDPPVVGWANTWNAWDFDPNAVTTVANAPGTDTFIWNKQLTISSAMSQVPVLDFYTQDGASLTHHQLLLTHTVATKTIGVSLVSNGIGKGGTSVTYTGSTPQTFNIHLHRMPQMSNYMTMDLAIESGGVETIKSTTDFLTSYVTVGSTNYWWYNANITIFDQQSIATPYIDLRNLSGSNLLLTRTGFQESYIVGTDPYLLDDQNYVLGLYDAPGSGDRTGIVGQGNANFISTFTETVTGTGIRRGTIAANSTATTVCRLTATRRTGSTMSATATVTATLTKVQSTSAAITATSTVSVTAKRFRSTGVPLATTATVTAQPYDFTKADVALQTIATVTATATRIKQIAGHFDAFVTELSIVNRIGQGFIHMDSTAAVTATGQVIVDRPIYLRNETTLIARGVNVQFGQAFVQSTATMSATVDKIKKVTVDMSATTSVTCNIGVIRRTGSSVTAEFTQTTATTNSRIVGARSQQSITTALTVNNQIIRLGRSAMTVSTAMETIAGIMVRFDADLQCQGFELVTGDVIHIDPYYQIKIRPETRQFRITPETRIRIVKSETRVNKIKGRVK